MADTLANEYKEVEIVAVSSDGFKFLEDWGKVLKPYKIIGIHIGDPNVNVYLPAGLNIEPYTQADFERKLGQRHWIFSGDSMGARSFGFLFTKKRFVYTLEEGCFLGKTPSGDSINAVHQHVCNLLTPSTPFFFNTLYDPYAKGSDFVRGYPFTLRQGVPTALSHGEVHVYVSLVDKLGCLMLLRAQGISPRLPTGLWNNVPDYDAPTSMCKPMERNARYVDAVMTVPKVVVGFIRFSSQPVLLC